MSPKVSIVVPTFNRGQLLAQTLDSLIAQTVSDWECLVVDDHSTDGSFNEVKNQYVKETRISFQLRPNELQKGANACRNHGMEKAQGDFLIFLDSDDLLAPDCLERRLNTAKNHPEFNLWISKMTFFKETVGDDKRVVNKYDALGNAYLDMFLSYQLPWQLTANFIRQSAVVRFNEALLRFQDVDFAIRLLLSNGGQCFVNPDSEPDSYYRVNLKSNPDNPDPIYLNNVNVSLFEFFKSVLPKLKESSQNNQVLKNQKQLLRKFYLRNFSLYVLPNISSLDYSYKKLRLYLHKEGVITWVDSLKFGLLEKLYLNGWDKKKGTGTYTLSRKWLRL